MKKENKNKTNNLTNITEQVIAQIERTIAQ
jgi:hypothetical protein